MTMAASQRRPVVVVVPGSMSTPAHFAALQHALHQRGFPTLCALLPSTGSAAERTVDDDRRYVREQMLLPVLDLERRDVVLVLHSYGGVPGGAAARGLSKTERQAAGGHSTGILGQIYIAAVLAPGGDGKDLLALFGGQIPPHVRAEESTNLLHCDDPKSAVFQDVPNVLADAACGAMLPSSLTSLRSPIPTASWADEAFRGRCAFIRTLQDQAVPLTAQDMMIAATGQQWTLRDMDTGHNPQLVMLENSANMIVELIKTFQSLEHP